MYDKIWETLKESNIATYPVGTHKGEIKESFVVVLQYDDHIINTNIKKRPFQIWIQHPLGHHDNAKKFLNEVMECLSEITGLRRNYDDFPLSVDDAKKGYVAMISYFINVRR